MWMNVAELSFWDLATKAEICFEKYNQKMTFAYFAYYLFILCLQPSGRDTK